MREWDKTTIKKKKKKKSHSILTVVQSQKHNAQTWKLKRDKSNHKGRPKLPHFSSSPLVSCASTLLFTLSHIPHFFSFTQLLHLPFFSHFHTFHTLSVSQTLAHLPFFSHFFSFTQSSQSLRLYLYTLSFSPPLPSTLFSLCDCGRLMANVKFNHLNITITEINKWQFN